ncbi:hypothetical protein DVH24_041468 [Malus domestica]|uniref:F-box domain-containing protein n=1 Tax=Malus domestica TaxID=3750 RepID=A0A498IFM1_MALDO|nr:hypothetical protein DVH24_041468 [Malus domestica]
MIRYTNFHISLYQKFPKKTYRPIQKTEGEWRAVLSPEQLRILREEGTEPKFTGEYDKAFEEGVYKCAGCGTPFTFVNPFFKSQLPSLIPDAVGLHSTRMGGEVRSHVQLAAVTWGMFLKGKGTRCRQMNATVSTAFPSSLFLKHLHYEVFWIVVTTDLAAFLRLNLNTISAVYEENTKIHLRAPSAVAHLKVGLIERLKEHRPTGKPNLQVKEDTGPTFHFHGQLPSHFPPPPEIKNAERKEREKPYESKQKSSSSSRYTTAADDQQPPPTTTAMAAAQTSLQISTPPAVYSHGHPLKAPHQNPLRLQFHAIGYSPCFVSLYNVSRAEEVKRVQGCRKRDNLPAEESSDLPREGSYDSASEMQHHKSTKLNSGRDWPSFEASLPTTTNSSANPDFTWRAGAPCSLCNEHLGYVFSGNGFPMCLRCSSTGLTSRASSTAGSSANPAPCILRSPTPGILIKTTPPKTKSRKLDYTWIEEHADSHWGIEKMRFTRKNSLPNSDFKVINSCNGLPCLSGPGKHGPLYVCNPILGEYIAFPPANNGRQSGMFVGLGFSAATNEYKVLQTFYPECESSSPDNLYETDTSTIGTGVWRSIENAPWDYVCLSFNAFLHGALHWVSESTRCSEFIRSFSFEREHFQILPAPSCFTKWEKELADCLKLRVIGDCLFICVYGDDPRQFDCMISAEICQQCFDAKEKYLSLLCTAHIHLPRSLVTDILSRLYVKTVFNCRCVSKEWLSIISDPQLTHLRASRSPAGILIKVASIAAIGNKEKGGPCKLEQLPQALVTDILSRLSVKTVFNCRCVSKEWLSIISDPQFIHLHASRSPNGILIKDYPPHGRSRNAYFTHVDQFVGSDFRLEKISPSFISLYDVAEGEEAERVGNSKKSEGSHGVGAVRCEHFHLQGKELC